MKLLELPLRTTFLPSSHEEKAAKGQLTMILRTIVMLTLFLLRLPHISMLTSSNDIMDTVPAFFENVWRKKSSKWKERRLTNLANFMHESEGFSTTVLVGLYRVFVRASLLPILQRMKRNGGPSSIGGRLLL